MRALRPDLVREAEIADFTPRTVAMERDFRHLRAGRPAAFAWKAEDLHPSGAMGDARLGSAEAGRAALDHGAIATITTQQHRHEAGLAMTHPPRPVSSPMSSRVSRAAIPRAW